MLADFITKIKSMVSMSYIIIKYLLCQCNDNITLVALPTIIKQPSSTIVEANNVATFECSARSYGTPSITWKRFKSELPVTATVTVTKSLNEIASVLRIEKTIGYYEGYYYCVIENSVGQVNSSLAFCKITGEALLVCLLL